MKKIFIFLFFAFIGLSNINGATFTSVSSGTWSTPATWSRVGADADGMPDRDDDIIISSGHTIILTALQNDFKSLVISATSTLNINGKALNAYGNFTNNGTLSGTFYYFRFFTPCILTSSSPITNPGVWYVFNNLTIPVGTVINKANQIQITGTAVVTNSGSVTITTSSLHFANTASWINAANSFLQIGTAFTGTVNLNSSAIGNTVVCATNCNTVPSTTFYNLILSATNTSTKTASGNITVLNDFQMNGANSTFNLNNFNLTVGGNWSNLANSTILNQGTIAFNGSGTQTISRTSTEVFNNLTLNGSGTVLLARSITVNGTSNFNSGTLDPSASNFTVNLVGNVAFNGSSVAQRGVLNFNGSSAQTISGSATANLFNVRSANTAGVSVTSTVVISNTLSVVSGPFGTSGSGIITIPATGATTYGRIAPVGGSLTGTGWRIESYINGPAPKGWQWLSSPINGNILADWDNDPRFYMSGVGGNDGMAATFKSVRTYNETTNLYTNITTTNTPLTPGRGFHIWMADNNTTGLTAPLVYNSIGTPNFGTINFPITEGGAGGGYNLVGNPYACPITYSTVVAASGNLYSTFVILLEDNSYSYDANGGIIAPNQGFMCVADAPGNIVFTEAAKNIVSTPNILKVATKNDVITFSVYNNINGVSGRTNIEFSNNVTDNFEKGKDLYFLASPSDEADNIYTKSTDNIPLLKNMLMNNGEDKHVSLTVKSGVYGSHFISTKGLANLSLYNSVWLEDLTTGNKVDLLKNQEYEFNADEIGKDYEFVIHFSTKKQNATNGSAIVNSLNENTSVYNTPSNVIVKFDMQESTPVTISVYNLAGQKVTELSNLNVTNDRIALPLQKENGLYLLTIQSEDQQITRKIIY